MDFCRASWLFAAVDSQAGRLQVRPVCQGLCLKVIQVALHCLVVERPGHVIVRADRFISQQLPQVGQSLHPGEFRRGDIGLELEQLQLHLQQIVLAYVPCLISLLADGHCVLKALEVLLRQLQSRFGEFNIDEQSRYVEAEAALVVSDLGACHGGNILGCLQAVLPLLATLKQVADA